MKSNQTCQKRNSFKSVIWIFALISILSLNAQKKYSIITVKCKVDYLKIDTLKNQVKSIKIIPTIGFEKKADMFLKLNNKIISKCNNCKTNESIGFVQENKSEEDFYFFNLDYSKIKVGDILEFKYNKEKVIYKVEIALFHYSALYIYRINNEKWELSFEPVRNGNIE